MKYTNEDNNVNTYFGYNKLGERYKCCCKCREYGRISGATYRESNKDKLKEYRKTYYQEHKQHIMDYKNEYRQKKKVELSDIIADGELSNFKHSGNNIIPHFDDITEHSKIRLRYYINGVKFEKKLGYKQKGYAQTKHELEQYFKHETTKP